MAFMASSFILLLCAQHTFGAAIAVLSGSSGSVTSTGIPSTITPAPNLPISEQAVPVNTCSYYNKTESQILWNEPWCSFSAGDIQLTYWPTSGNASYPKTVYNSELDYTFTSPSVYMIVKTMFAFNPCGALGPTTFNAIFDFNLEDVSTLVPYTDLTATTRMSTRQLVLNDLNHDCPTSVDVATMDGDHPMDSPYLRCNPAIAPQKRFKQIGQPYWEHCGVMRNKYGINDPPFAVQPLQGLVLASTTNPTSQATPTMPAATAPIVASDVAPSTSVVATTSTESTSDVANDGNPLPTSSTSITQEVESAATSSVEGPPAIVSPAATEAKPAAEGPSSTVNPPQSSSPTINEPSSAQPEVAPTAAVENQFPAPTGLPTDAVTPFTHTIAQQVISLGPSGLEVAPSAGGPTSTFAVPAVGATQVSVGVGPASTVVYQGVTITMGSAAQTISSVMVVGYSGSGSESVSPATNSANTTSSMETFTGAAERMRHIGVVHGFIVGAIGAFLML